MASPLARRLAGIVDGEYAPPMSSRFVCPRCTGPLAAAGSRDHRCAACGVDYPTLQGSAILVPAPWPHLAAACVQAEWLCQALGTQLAVADELAAKAGYRAPVARRVAEGVRANLALVRRQQQSIIDRLDVRALLDYVVPSVGGPSPLAAGFANDRYSFSAVDQYEYARTDWSGTPEGEEQIRITEEAVFELIDRHCPERASAVVLGAGAGRVLFDLTSRFEQVLGIDSNYRYVDFFHRLAEGPIRFAQVNVRLPVSDETVVTHFTAALPADAGERLSRIGYAVADAKALPIATGSQSAVVCVFFADVIPLHFLLKEASRVLKPGGKLVNFGSLSYCFSDSIGHLTPGEAEHVIRSFGFRVEEQRTSEMWFHDFRDVGGRRAFRIWSYALTKEA